MKSYFPNRYAFFASIFIFLILGISLSILKQNLSFNSVILDLQSSDRNDTYQLFYDVGDSFKESHSVKTHVEKNRGGIKVIFKIPDGRKIKKIRIDPGYHSGTILIKKITLNYCFSYLYRTELYSWSAREIASSFLPVNHIDDFKEFNGYLYVKSVGEDPYFVSNVNFEDIYRSIDLKNIRSVKINLFVLFVIFIALLIIRYRLLSQSRPR